LSERRLVWKRDLLTNEGCWFLGEKGCILDPVSRPFICHTYICQDLETEMKRRDPELVADLSERFAIIGRMRTQLRAEFFSVDNS